MANALTTKFPFISLTKALDRAKSLYESDPGNKGMAVPIAFAAWDYSEKSSGGFQTISALKQYGIADDEGAKDDRRVKLTDHARTYFATEIDADKKRLEHQFALSPTIVSHLADQWNNSCPPDNVARTYLKTEVGLNEQSARSLLGIYKDNLNFVDPLDLSEVDTSSNDSNSDEFDDENMNGNGHKTGNDSRSSSNPEYQQPSNSQVDRDIFSVPEGEVALISPKELSRESLEDISDWLDIMKRKLSRKLSI